MFRRSLTAKVLIAVGLTVAGVIGIYSYFVIRVQSTWWIERTEAQNVISATLVREYLEGVMLSERHEEVSHFLGELKKSSEIIRGRIVTPEGRVVFSTETQEVGRVQLTVPPAMFNEDNRVLQNIRRIDGENVAVAMSPVHNRPSCTKCHSQTNEHLGVIVLEKSLATAEASIATNRNLLIVYGLIIFVLVSVVLWLLIVRLISQPVAEVLEQMQRVEHGDLAARAGTERVDEIGLLERGFDGMVESLEAAKRELHESHEKQMQQAGKLATIGELASGIAHEIRNPLAGIGAAVEVMAESNPGNTQFGEIAGEMRRQVQRLNTTLRDLLDFARQREPEIVPCDVCAELKPMLALIRSDAQKNHVAIVEHCPADLPPVCADVQQMQQALLNVLLNAVQAMPDGGTLTISAEVVDKTLKPGHPKAVRLSVQDTGVGITAENRERIFTPFFTTKHRGTGLGLAITRTIMEKHGGAITMESNLGHGTTFTLQFAACAAQEVLAHV